MANDAVTAIVTLGILGMAGNIPNAALHAYARVQGIRRELRPGSQRQHQKRVCTAEKRPLPQSCWHVYPSLEIEVKSHQYFAGVDVGGRKAKTWARAILMQPVIFVMPSQTGAARHKWVVAETDGVRADIAEVGWGWTSDAVSSGRYIVPAVSLLRHPFSFIPGDEDQLRTVYVVAFEGGAVPDRRLRSHRKSFPRNIVQRAAGGWTRTSCGCAAVSVGQYGVAIALAKPRVIRAVLGNNR